MRLNTPKRLLLLFGLMFSIVHIQATINTERFSFEKFPYSEKLPSNSVIRIYQDNEGYMWFGTKDGLCRFDGYDIKTFRSSALTPGKLTNNEIRCLTEDNNNQLWVGTVEGINIINKRNYSIRQLDNQFAKKDRINSILNDSRGYIWVATSSNGVLKINPTNGEFERYSTDKSSGFKLRGNNVTQIYEDKVGRIWISLWKNGLGYIDPKTNKMIYMPTIGSSDNPFRVFQDRENVYWICTWGDGIFNLTIDKSRKVTLQHMQQAKGSSGKMDDIVYSITQDNKFGNIWVVTFSGLTMIEKGLGGTYKMVETSSFFNESGNKLFHEIIKDRKGNLWVGSVGEGLYNLDFNKLSIQNYPLTEIRASLNARSYVTRFCEVPTGEVYIVINRIGLFSFNPQTGAVKRPTNPVVRSLSSISALLNVPDRNEIWVANEGEDKIHIFKKTANNDLIQSELLLLNDSKTAVENTISSLFKDSKGNVWIGSGNGLYIKSPNSPIKLVTSKIYSVNTIEEDTKKNIWIGTEKDGAYLFKNKIQGTKNVYTSSKVGLNIHAYQSYSVQSICCKKNGDVYLGTKEGCLYYYSPQNHTTKEISGLYGITDDGIMDILEDNYGMLWISTIKRIIKFNPQTHAATYFSNADGILVSSFFKDARIKLRSGKILFGGNNGICSFTPTAQVAVKKPFKQHVFITDILLQNKSIFNNELNFHFNPDKNKVTFAYAQNNISIEFSALDFSAASKIQYAYKLSGVDNKWNYVSNNRRFVNYANLPDGSYTFQVKASDENGIWSDQITSLEVLIRPPFYRTWWAYLIYLLIIGGATYFVFKTVANRIHLRNEVRISRIEKEKSEELAQIKLRYFTNISHELLTPLTIIMLLIERLQSKNSSDSAQFDIMKDNINRLRRLIQQILVFRKTESGNMKLKILQNDIVGFVNNICQSNFCPLINEKEIHFSIESECDSYMAYFDPDKLDKVIYNLLSNAFKHTPKGGFIQVKMNFITRMEDVYLRLSVSDSGSGIAEVDLPHIFKRFYISSNSDQSQSHGIGLALTNDLLQIHKGSVEVKSKLGEGAVFSFEIPISQNAYTDDELSIEEQKIEPVPEMPELATVETMPESVEASDAAKELCILVVEDNRELKNLIADHFCGNYKVLTAENGLQALELVRENEIDLIISDVMMPEMDGLTFCKIIKEDISTSHINVLMLTAKNSTEDRIDCYNAGADSYIAKPFEVAVLEARTKNLISKRKQKTDTFKKNKDINISSMEYGSLDELFLQQAVQTVEKRLADDTFDFDDFAIDMASSKSTLHRKLKSLTGLSPGEFIRNIRLKHAAQMLANNIGNISEIAFAVGFNDPKYFSRCFKVEFGMTPREYQESKKA